MFRTVGAHMFFLRLSSTYRFDDASVNVPRESPRLCEISFVFIVVPTLFPRFHESCFCEQFSDSGKSM